MLSSDAQVGDTQSHGATVKMKITGQHKPDDTLEGEIDLPRGPMKWTAERSRNPERTMSTSSDLDDLRHAARGVRGMPIVAAVIVGSLALGIGVNTIVFSWMQALLLRPLPGVSVRLRGAPDRDPVTETGGRPGASWPEFEDVRRALAPVTRWPRSG